MSLKVCFKEVNHDGLYGEKISITIDTHVTFFNDNVQDGLNIFEKFGNLYTTNNSNSGDLPILTHGEIGFDDILLAIEYCSTEEALKEFDTKTLNSIKKDFVSMRSYLYRTKKDVFSIYIL